MSRKGRIVVSEFAKLYRGYIDRLKKLGCEFCPTCHAYLTPGHPCRAFEPVFLPAPLEAYTFAADREVA